MKKVLLITALSVSATLAQVKSKIEVPYIDYHIKTAKGSDTLQANCLMCHSFGYVVNQGAQPRKFWHEKIEKMIHAFKAPINQKDAKIIEDYLTKNYGK